MKHLRVRLLLLTSGLLVGLLLTEVVHRIARTQICTGPGSSSIFTPDTNYGWKHRRKASGWFFGCDGQSYEFSNRVRTNSNGLRDHETPYEKPPHSRRVLLLGDSMTEAVQVPLGETFSERAEELLSDSLGHVEVINTGCAGYGTDNEVLFYRHEGVRYDADLVVLVLFTRNDVIDVSSTLHPRMTHAVYLPPKRYFTLDANDGLRLEKPAPPAAREPSETVVKRWYRNIRSQLFVLRALERLMSAPNSQLPPATTERSGPVVGWQAVYSRNIHPEIARGWKLIEKLIIALRDDVQRTGAELLVVIMPSREEVAIAGPPALHPPIAKQTALWNLDQANQISREILDRIGVEYLNVLPPLRSHVETTGSTGFFAIDIHLAPDGHGIVGSELARWLEPRLAKLVTSQDPSEREALLPLGQ